MEEGSWLLVLGRLSGLRCADAEVRVEGTADTGLDRLGDAQMQKWVKAWGGVLVGMKDGSGGGVCRGGWGSTGTLCFSVGSGQAPGTLQL